MLQSIDVKVEMSKKLRDSGADVEQTMDELAPAISKALAVAIRGRVAERGDLAGQAFPGYDARGSYPVSGRYPHGGMMPLIIAIKGKRPKAPDAKWFRNSVEFHQGVVPGSYYVSGGMWSGLTVMVRTPTLVQLLFRGRSEGQDPRFINGQSRPLKVSNALKAWTVLTKHGVNVLQISEAELAAVGNGSVQAIASGIGRDLPVEWQGEAPPHASVTAILSVAINGR